MHLLQAPQCLEVLITWALQTEQKKLNLSALNYCPFHNAFHSLRIVLSIGLMLITRKVKNIMKETISM